MSDNSEDRRWELIFKEINQSITSEERTELDSLQKAVWEKRKSKPKKAALIDAETY